MTYSHTNSMLLLKDTCIQIDDNNTFLCHYDITAEDIRGIAPITNTATLTGIVQEKIYDGGKLSAGYKGKFGGGVVVEEGTTNIVTNTDLNTGWSKGYCTGILWNDILPPVGINSPVVSFYDADADKSGYWYSYGDYAPQDPGVTYTVSLYVKTNDSNFSIYFYTADNAEAGRYTSETIVVPNDGLWHRVVWNSFTNAAGSQSDSLSFRFYFGNSQGETQRTWLCAPQMEAKPFATSFVVGTRAQQTLTYDPNGIINLDEGTMACWFKPMPGFFGTVPDTWNRIIGHSTAVNRNEIQISNRYGTNKVVASISNDAGTPATSWSAIQSATSFVAWNWYHVCFTWSKSAGVCKLYVNGVLESSLSNIPAASFPSAYGLFAVGNQPTHGRRANSIIDEVRVDKIARTDEEILSWYISNRPFYPRGRHKLVR